MQNLVFNVAQRSEKGKKVRMNGQIPGIIYGESLEKSIPCKMDRKEMLKLLSSSRNSVLALNLDGTMEHCVLKEVQRNIFGEIIHLDFQYVKKGDLVKLKVPVNFVGQGYLESKRLLLEVFVSEVQVQGHLEDIPENLTIDVSKLEHGDSILLKDLHISDKLKADIDEDKVIATVGELISKEQEEMIEEEIESSTEE